MMIDHIWTTRRAESTTSNPERLPLLGNFTSEDKVQSYTDGKKDDLMVFFESSLPSTIAKIAPSQASNDNPFEPIETIEQAQQPNSPNDLVVSIEPVTTSIASARG